MLVVFLLPFYGNCDFSLLQMPRSEARISVCLTLGLTLKSSTLQAAFTSFSENCANAVDSYILQPLKLIFLHDKSTFYAASFVLRPSECGTSSSELM
jgi:hypothetical protein